MSEIKPLTSKDGRSEWPFETIILVAVPEINVCKNCYLWDTHKIGEKFNCNKLPICNEDFEEPIIYIVKPSEK